MNDLPKTFTAETAPREVIALAESLVPQLLVGEHLAMIVLREQYDRVQISSVDLTGVGFFVNYEVPDDSPRTKPPDIVGGHADIEAEGLSIDAGCVLFVRDGLLSFLEIYTYGDSEVWSEQMKVIAIKNISPLCPPAESITS